MPLKVTVTMPDFPDDTELDVRGMGLFINGQARDLTEDEELAYYVHAGHPAKNGVEATATMTATGTPSVKDSDLPELPSSVEPIPYVELEVAPMSVEAPTVVTEGSDT